MARIWANRLEAGTQVWANCPIARRDAVLEVMRNDVETGRNGMTQERLDQIINPDKETK